MALRAVLHASEILTGDGIRKKDGVRVVDADLGRIRDGALVYRTKKVGKQEVPDRIEWVGATQELPARYRRLPSLNLKGKQAVTPGLVDCHTHLVFAGDRAGEFSERCAGVTYETIAQKGGGILATVRATREASEAELLRLASERMKEIYKRGVRTIEIKSGYGLSLESELKILRVIQALKKKFPQMTVTSTYLGAHAIPPDRQREEYLIEMEEKALPLIRAEGLADSCDVFVDAGYFTRQEAMRLLKVAQKLGLQAKIHADELTHTDSATLAADLGALSADHLLKISDQGIQALAKSSTVAVLLPGTAFYLKANHAPARKLIDQGVRVALATDFNPGTFMGLSLPSVMTIAALYLGMSCAEIFASVTYNGARALGLAKSKGTLKPGMDADFWILPFQRFEDTYYRFAW